MAWSAVSKSEMLRRQREQVQLARDNIARLSRALETGNFAPYAHRKTVIENGKAKTGPLLTDEEMRAYVEQKLVECKEQLKVWEEPFDFGEPTKEQPVRIPKAVARAMQKVRKRTRRMLRKRGSSGD